MLSSDVIIVSVGMLNVVMLSVVVAPRPTPNLEVAYRDKRTSLQHCNIDSHLNKFYSSVSRVLKGTPVAQYLVLTLLGNRGLLILKGQQFNIVLYDRYQ
jgi:hypothetical protein